MATYYPTPSPSKFPTFDPTRSPSKTPTTYPTRFPTIAPTPATQVTQCLPKFAPVGKVDLDQKTQAASLSRSVCCLTGMLMDLYDTFTVLFDPKSPCAPTFGTNYVPTDADIAWEDARSNDDDDVPVPCQQALKYEWFFRSAQMCCSDTMAQLGIKRRLMPSSDLEIPPSNTVRDRECAPGKFEFLTECVACPSGKFSSKFGADTCSDCPPDQAQNDLATKCTAAPTSSPSPSPTPSPTPPTPPPALLPGVFALMHANGTVLRRSFASAASSARPWGFPKQKTISPTANPTAGGTRLTTKLMCLTAVHGIGTASDLGPRILECGHMHNQTQCRRVRREILLLAKQTRHATIGLYGQMKSMVRGGLHMSDMTQSVMQVVDEQSILHLPDVLAQLNPTPSPTPDPTHAPTPTPPTPAPTAPPTPFPTSFPTTSPTQYPTQKDWSPDKKRFSKRDPGFWHGTDGD
jgi:hypothetical protein